MKYEENKNESKDFCRPTEEPPSESHVPEFVFAEFHYSGQFSTVGLRLLRDFQLTHSLSAFKATVARCSYRSHQNLVEYEYMVRTLALIAVNKVRFPWVTSRNLFMRFLMLNFLECCLVCQVIRTLHRRGNFSAACILQCFAGFPLASRSGPKIVWLRVAIETQQLQLSA